MEFDVDPDVFTKAGREHLLFLALCERVGATEESKEFVLVIRHRAGLPEKMKFTQWIAFDRRLEAIIAEDVELLPRRCAAAALQMGIPMERVAVEVEGRHPNLLLPLRALGAKELLTTAEPWQRVLLPIIVGEVKLEIARHHDVR
jgi:hypothetical protein